MIAHGAPFANGAHPHVPIGEPITDTGEGITPPGEGIADTLARLSERLAIVAVAAHIMEQRHPRDCYARSIARETHALTVELRETIRQAHTGAPMRAPRIVDAASSTDGEPIETPAPARRSTTQKRRQTPPDARHTAQACERGERAAQSDASPNASLGASGAEGGAQ